MTSVPSGVPTAPPTRPLFPATIIPTYVENTTPMTPQNQHRTDLSELCNASKERWFRVAQSVVMIISNENTSRTLPYAATQHSRALRHCTYLDWTRTTWCRQPRTFTVCDMCHHQQLTVSSAQSRVGYYRLPRAKDRIRGYCGVQSCCVTTVCVLSYLPGGVPCAKLNPMVAAPPSALTWWTVAY